MATTVAVLFLATVNLETVRISYGNGKESCTLDVQYCVIQLNVDNMGK